MLHLVTGTNGSGKTLNTLKWVMERATKENRPVAHNGRFKPVPGGPLEGWKQIEFKDWQAEPDGTIFIIDECHNDLPNRPSGAAVPESVKMLAEHRRRGFDFYLISQHPANVDSFVRRLIGSPGWHRHLKRIWGQDVVSCLEWDSVNLNCEKPGSSKSTGTSTTVKFPKEVYTWYESATLHTNKKKIPKAAWMFLIAVAVALVFAYISFGRVSAIGGADSSVTAKAAAGASSASGGGSEGVRPPMTPAEYAASFKSRLGGFPHTAPRYDDVTKPVTAPYPAACVEMKSKGCTCYSQQGTKLLVPDEICTQIVKNGYFVDWEKPQANNSGPAGLQERPSLVAQSAPVPQTVPMPEPKERPSPAALDGYSQGLAARNAQVRSVLQ
ncbi:zonular occludens toxin domain-containing protein [Comamonas sp. 26]|uniref:zonular occludens toxin domain-containing protein n=1 Tax=Comamonas sp. 26 TaxID=2035201 RepID=UPI000C18BF52|nr:zonular occludens toxin domain-containing protein [Comamonas sp. 26]PIG00383.1 zona occludens toxin [Comamonas sp. 26]